MASIGRFLFWRHLRAEPNQHVLHYRRGRLVRSGAGLAYWFNPLSAAVAQLPVEDCETTFLLRERSHDLQEVTVQCTLTYRVVDPEKASRRVNFSLSLATGAWLEQPLERLASVWAQLAQPPARAYLQSVSLEEATRNGADVVRARILDALAADAELAGMGLAVVNLQIVRVAPSAELEKALQTPTREALQQRADEASFARRAYAVEKERAIKQNELATELDLAARQEELIAQHGRNTLRQVGNEAESERARVEAQLARQALEANAYASQVVVRAHGDAESARVRAAAAVTAEEQRLAVYRDAPTKVIFGLALQEAAGKLSTINHLNLTPDLLRESFVQLLRDADGEPSGR